MADLRKKWEEHGMAYRLVILGARDGGCDEISVTSRYNDLVEADGRGIGLHGENLSWTGIKGFCLYAQSVLGYDIWAYAQDLAAGAGIDLTKVVF